MFFLELALMLLAVIIVLDIVGLGLWMLCVLHRERRQARYGEVQFVSFAAGEVEDRAIARARLILNQ